MNQNALIDAVLTVDAILAEARVICADDARLPGLAPDLSRLRNLLASYDKLIDSNRKDTVL